MIPVNHPSLEKYLFQLASVTDEPVLNEMESYGRAHRFPIIDRLVGMMIKLLALTSGAKSVFELGSGYGYSAYWFSQAMGSAGQITCTDGDEANRKKAEDYLTRAGVWERVDFKIGEAISLLEGSSDQFDIVYNDIDKGDYPKAWKVARNKVLPGGLYICDNTLWSGRVAEEIVTDDIRPGWTEAIKEHNELVFQDKDFDTSLIPLRDGVIVARKKK